MILNAAIYLVGGAVRDALLGLPVIEKDYVVVGSTPEAMHAQGFKQVGADFPVFLHPETQEEYALARTERKSGVGYHGFNVHFGAEVRLEEDLLRRDLTINAMAQDATGQIIDPYGGQHDLQEKYLRHVSPAFAEDPLRVLRVARFAARFAGLGFRVAPETLQLMQQIVQVGELAHLTPERVWKETSRALMHDTAPVYFEVLRSVGALRVIFPEIDALFGVPQRPEYHPEIDTGVHTLMSLQQACRFNMPLITRFAVLLHDLGKALTPEDVLPRHIGHEHRGVPLVTALCTRLKVPVEFKVVAELVCRDHLLMHQIMQLKPATIYALLKRMDVLRKPERLEVFVDACYCDATGRTGFEQNAYPQKEYLFAFAHAMRHTPMDTLKAQYAGSALGEAIQRARIQAIAAVKKALI